MSIDFKVLPLRRLQVRELVRAWHEAVLDVSASAAERAARKLDEQLGLGEILERLPRRVRSLTVVPDDALHGFPFAALPYQDGYLVERFAVSMAYQSTARRLRRRKDTRRRALVAGVDLPVGDLSALPATGRQLRRVVEWLARRGVTATPVVNHGVSRSFLVEEIPRAGLCHLSCHGAFRPEDPDGTGLVLLPQDGQEQILSLRDLLGLRLDGVCHVTLVSCWAADNFIFPGRWIVSLPEILWRRGAASVVGCLWEVEDRSAVQFLRRFYSALDRLPRDQALRHAQIRALRDRRTADPLVWAGFQLYGDPGKLRL
jgi:CHAT domain-containing protein